MSKHQLHTAISYNILTYDLSRVDDYVRLSLIRDYEGGNIIIIKGYDFEIDLDVFDAIDPPHGWINDHRSTCRCKTERRRLQRLAIRQRITIRLQQTCL